MVYPLIYIVVLDLRFATFDFYIYFVYHEILIS